jgi:hypothetical protein
MTLAKLCTIPCIHVEEISDTGIRITADDGFRLVLRKADRLLGPFWEFQNSPPSAISHFHLRYLINKALNT